MTEKASREELLNRIEKAAHDYEEKFHGCSRCAFKALQDHLELGDGTALKVAGILAVGIVTAKEELEDSDAMMNSLGAGFRLARKVEKELGSTNCTQIQTERLGRFYSLADPEQYKAFVEGGGYVECPKVVGKVARLTAEFILDYLEKKKSQT